MKNLLKYEPYRCWNRCDFCGRFIAYNDFDNGASREMILPDSDYSNETYETICIKCNYK